MLRVSFSRMMLVFTIVATPLLAGSSCAFFFSSGGGSSDSDDDEDKKGLVIVAKNGRFVDAPVMGVNYESGSLTGITGENGQFQYEPGNTVRFYIGDIGLGRAVQGKSIVTPLDLVEDGTSDSTAVINIARLLQSLDSQPGDDVITIPDTVRRRAVRSNQGVYSAIEFLDFHDDLAFINAASQLVAVLTRDYPHTAVLVDKASARSHMIRSIRGLQDKSGNDTPQAIPQ